MSSNYVDTPIIVTGCARSGTSLVAGVLAMCGAWVGAVTGPTRWNRKGQFENEQIRDRLTKPLLRSLGIDPMGQDLLPDPVVHWPVLAEMGSKWREKVLEVIHAQWYQGNRAWMFKGAKACLVWPVWREAFPNARWVVVRRDDERIVDSCMRTSFMRKRRTRESWQEWVDYHKHRFVDIRMHCSDSREFWPGRAMAGGSLQLWRMLVEELGLIWNEDRVAGFLEPGLWNGG